MSKIQVNTNKVRFPVAPDLYGLFFEDINRSADGGLYPEMLRNRSFEDSILPLGCHVDKNNPDLLVTPTDYRSAFCGGEGRRNWNGDTLPTPIPAWYSDRAEMELDREYTLNASRLASLKVSFKADGYIKNVGFKGISVEEGKSYDFYIFASSPDAPEILLSCESSDGDKVYFSKTVRITSKGFGKYQCGFVSKGTDHNAVFKIAALSDCSVSFGYCSLMPAETYNGHGMRIDLMEKLEAMHPKFLRFPGGCIVEGFTEDTMMRFKKTVGNPWERPTIWNLWDYRTTNGLGFHEYLQICEDLDLEPMYVFNCGMTCQGRNPIFLPDEKVDELIQEVKDAIEYATGDVTTKWGALRAEMGHPAPFKMTYIEIGNENWGEEYRRRYLRCYNELKKCYPNIRFISNCHTEYDGLPTEIADEHFYSSPEFFAENIRRYDNYYRSGTEIFVGEFAVTAGKIADCRAAVSEAMFMLGMERNQDAVTLASYAPLFENSSYRAWEPNLICFDNHQSYAIPSYYAWKLFSSNRGKAVLESKTRSGKVYRPFAGVPSLMGAPDTRFKNPIYGGKPIAFTDIMGHSAANGDGGFTVSKPTDEQSPNETFRRDTDRWPEFLKNIFLVADTSEIYDSFSVDVLVEESKPVHIGIATSKKTEGIGDWMDTRGHYNILSWVTENGYTKITEGPCSWQDSLCEQKPVALKMGEYNNFAYKTTENGGELYINGQLVMEYEFLNHPTVASVALDDGDGVILKIVNCSDNDEQVEISIDCDVESGYTVQYFSGDPDGKNSYSEPERICDKTCSCEGAGREFSYLAPAWSVNVLKLKKI